MISKKLFLPAVLIFCLLFGSGLAAEDDSINTISEFLQKNQFEQRRQLERISDPDMLFADNFNDFPGFEDDLYKLKHHSVGRAFLYSLILPGAGEIYTGSKLKASLFFGIEIFSWYQYINKYGDGQDLEDQYRDYANQYWDPGDYRAWLVDVMGVPSDTLPYRGEDGEPQTFTHHLPDFKTQQYYEMIGKYEQFVFGWADTDYNEGDSLSKTHRVTYLQLRDESNSKFDAARNYAIVSIANRIISAFDAALSARKLNKKADRFSEVRLKARLADYYGERIPKIILTYNFY
ncbi:MAG TPA: hypothetical protein ENO22_09170 [candidate division Zixibacteria bacterium]|nr:hypothetical protein [candidate division Zixibacteria bacterium]